MEECLYIEEYPGICPACGSPIDYCPGHGAIGDPVGHAILVLHDDDDEHSMCHPAADCQQAILSPVPVPVKVRDRFNQLMEGE